MLGGKRGREDEVVAHPGSHIPQPAVLRSSWRGGPQVTTVAPEKEDPSSNYVIIADVRCCIKPLKQSAKWANGFPPSEVTFTVYKKGDYAKCLFSTHVVYAVFVRDEIGGTQEILGLAKREMEDIPQQQPGSAVEGELFVRHPLAFLNAFSEVFKHIGSEVAHFIVPDEYSRKGLTQLFTWAVRKCGGKLPRYYVEEYAMLPGVTPICGDDVGARCSVHTTASGTACGKRCTKAYVHELHAVFLASMVGGGADDNDEEVPPADVASGVDEVVGIVEEDEVLNPDASDEDALED